MFRFRFDISLIFSLFFCCIFLFCCSSVIGQSNATIAIPLVRVAGVGPFYKNVKFIYKNGDCASHIGMPKNVEQSGCFQISLHPDQDLLDRSRNSGLLNEFEKNRLAAIDTNQFAQEKINHTVSVFTGVDQQKKIIIFDANQNKDFSDDLVLKFALDQRLQESSYWDGINTSIILNYERFNPSTKSIVRRDVIAKIYPFNIDDESDPLSFEIASFEHRLGTFKLGSQQYNIAMATFGPLTDDFSNVEVATTIAGDGFEATKGRFKIGDFLQLAEQQFLVERVSAIGDTIFFKPMEQPAEVKTVKDDRIIPFEKSDLAGNLINTKNYANQYLLLNFWGTWCGPCVEKVPYLNDLHHSAASKNLILVGVAKDGTEKQVKEFVDQQNIKWKNIFESFSDLSKNSLTQLYEVTSYPTMILYLPDGKGRILADSPDEIKALESYLADLK